MIVRDVYVKENRTAVSVPIDYVQGTNFIGIKFNIADYDLPTGATAKVYVKKPSTKAEYDTATIDGNSVMIDVKDTMFSEKGTHFIQVLISKDDKTLVTFEYPVRVGINNVAGELPESTNRSNFIDEYMEKIDQKTDTANKLLEQAIEQQAQTEQSAIEAEQSATEAEQMVNSIPSWAKQPAPDKSLEMEGQAADAKAVGDELVKKADKDNPVFTGSISVGRKADTLVGVNSVAIGAHLEASGKYSIAEGYMTEASGNQSHAEGHATIAASTCQHVQGKYNIADNLNKYVHIIGNGTNTTRSNAHTVDWKGNGWYAGKLTQEGVPTNDKDLTTKKYVDDVSNEKLTKPATASVGQIFRVQSINEDGTFVLEAVDMPSGSGAVDDVRINGTSIVTDGVANISPASSDEFGVVKLDAVHGISSLSNGVLYNISANEGVINNRYSDVYPYISERIRHTITPYFLDYAVKAAMCDGKGAAWTADEQAAARARMGIGEYELIEEVVLKEDITELVRKVDLNGNPYKFKKMVITIESVENSATNSYLSIYNEFNRHTQIHLGYLSNTGNVISTQVLEIITDKVQLWYTTPTNNFRNIDTVATKAPTTLLGSDYKNICGLKYNGSFKAGSVFKIYGVRA